MRYVQFSKGIYLVFSVGILFYSSSINAMSSIPKWFGFNERLVELDEGDNDG